MVKVLILSSLSWSLINFRGPLIARMVEEGHDVVAGAPDEEPEVLARLAAMGVRFCRTPMSRAGTNPLDDALTLFHYLRLMRAERPDVVVAYTQKPIIYGGIAARLLGIRSFAIMSGLGYVFSGEAQNRRLLRTAVSRLYRLGVRRAECIFVFNGDDHREMLANGIVAREQSVLQVPGSGVDIGHFVQAPLPDGPFTFLMMGRLMRDKGVGEYVAAARIIRQARPDVRFLLLTRPENENPTGYTSADLQRWLDEGLIDFLPETRDVRPYLASAHAFVLPSFYREGLPRTILEAMATGRAVITTDMPGCREPIRHGVNGLLVPPRDPGALAGAMEQLLSSPALVRQMGEAARKTAVNIYDVNRVNDILIDTMHLRRTSWPTASPAAGVVRAGLARGGRMTGPFRPAGVAAILFVIILSPLLLILALAVLLDVGRPVLFRQLRSGLGGREFEMLKFRTMQDLRDARGEPLPDSARVTRLGRFLRRSRLDELPELINIARGEMAFVGPRPLLPHTIRALRLDGMERGRVRPGLTGLAQVSGNTLLSMEEKLNYDLSYVRNRSAVIDARILARTIGVIVGGERRIDRHADETRPPDRGS